MDASAITPPSVRYWALLPCAGSGSRAATVRPKQYQPIAGQPMVAHTLQAFAAATRLAGIVVVLAPGDTEFAGVQPGVDAILLIAHCGGETRAQSVLNGLRWLLQGPAQANDWVLVHDAARCLVTPTQIHQLIDACAEDAVGGLLAHKLADTLKQAGEPSGNARVVATVDRGDKWLAQTPQMFRLGTLIRALEQAGPTVTDESSAMEALGMQPLLIEGGSLNFKVTYPEDFALAEAVLLQRAMPGADKDRA